MAKPRELEKVLATSIVASAEKIDLSSDTALKALKKRHEAWQDEAWMYYDQIGEIKFGGRYLSNCVSKVRFFAAAQPNQDEELVSVDDAAKPSDTEENKGEPPFISQELADAANEELARLESDDNDAATIFAEGVINTWIAGECYLVGQKDEENQTETFEMFSDSEIIVKGKETRILGGPNDRQGKVIPEKSFFLRIWEKHPRFSQSADSNIRSILNECEELLILSRSIKAIALSRMSNGILLVAQELDFHGEPQTDSEGAGNTEDSGGFDTDLMDSMTTPVFDESSPASIVPLVVRLPLEMVEKAIKHIPLEKTTDKEIIERCNYLIRRIGVGLDLPPEVLTGFGDSNHWNAYVITEDAFRTHVEPKLLMLTKAITKGFLRPALLARTTAPNTPQFTLEEVKKVMIGYDPTALVTHPNRAQDAKDAHDRGTINDMALNRELGFAEADMPSDDEWDRMVAWKAAKASVDIGATQQPTGNQPAPVDNGKPATPNEVAASAAKKKDTNQLGQRLAKIDRDLMNKLLIAADMAMTRALEKAGARLRAKAKKNAAILAAVTNVDNVYLASHLGPTIVASLDDENTLLNGSFDSLHAKFLAWVKKAQYEALKELGIEYSDGEMETIDARMTSNREAGWTTLKTGLVAVAALRLYDPSPTAPLYGEFDPELSVQPSIIREAMQVIGEHTGLNEPVGGVATGDFIGEQLRNNGYEIASYTWTVGDPTRPFEPHQELDGNDFAGIQDPELSINESDSWLGVSFYEPGDHDGCQCSLEPNWVGGNAPE